jgi:hypothetical protein
MSYRVPLQLKNPDEGYIEYLVPKEFLDSAEGFFSFTFYIRDSEFGEATPKQKDLYLKGLDYYRQILKTPPFTTWKIVIYTDEFTIHRLRSAQTVNTSLMKNEKKWDAELFKGLSASLLTEPDIVFAVVTWPRYQRKKEVPQINGGVLRSLRSRLPFDFPDKYVFIRDADTFFDNTLKHLNLGGLYRNSKGEHSPELWKAAKDNFRDSLYQWEKGFFETIPEIQKVMGKQEVLIIGTGSAGFYSSLYKRAWHSNELLGKNAPFGVFAGAVSVTPGVPVYQTMEAWDDFIDYVKERSIRNDNHPSSKLDRKYLNYKRYDPTINTHNKFKEYYIGRRKNKEQAATELKAYEEDISYIFSNDEDIHRIGRDEQLYLFIIMPASIDNLFIFNLPLGDLNAPKVNLFKHVQWKRLYRDALEHKFVGEKDKKGGTRKRLRKTNRTTRIKKTRVSK